MGCLHSKQNKKKYLDDDPLEESQNRPPTDCEMTTGKRGDVKLVKQQNYQRKLIRREDNKINKGKDNNKKSQSSNKEHSVKSNKKTQPNTINSTNKITQKQKPISNRPVKIIRTTKQNPQVKQTRKNSITKINQHNLSKSQQKQQKKNAQQQQRILSILKRSHNIGRVYRKVCAQMIKYNIEEFQQKSEMGN